MNMILENKLNSILEDLSKHNRNKNDLIVFYINKRLDRSTLSYIKELEDNNHILLSNKDIYLLKRL